MKKETNFLSRTAGLTLLSRDQLKSIVGGDDHGSDPPRQCTSNFDCVGIHVPCVPWTQDGYCMNGICMVTGCPD